MTDHHHVLLYREATG